MIKVSQYGDVLRLDLARTIMGQGRYWTTAYYVDGFLVDTGCAYTAGELEEVLADKELHGIINTHSHEDHIGGNGPLQRRHTGLGIYAHPEALPVLEDPKGLQPLHFYRRLFWGWPEPSRAESISNNAEINTKHFTFRALYTPGHSSDHLCLYEPEQGWIFTGDLFVGGRDRALREDYNIWEIIASLRSISELELTRLFPGCAQVRDEPLKAIKKKLSYLEDLGGQVTELHKRGWKPSSIARELLGKPMWVEIVTMGHFSRRQLVLSFLHTKSNEGSNRLKAEDHHLR